jgi:rod shape determining protein RodA
MFSYFNKFKYFDIPLQIVTLLLAIVGLTLLYSTTIAAGSNSIFFRQAAFLLVGLAGFLFFSFFDYHTLAKANRIMYVVFIVLLVYLIVLGSHIKGSKRWIDLGFFNLQVAEFIKISIILGLARLMYLRRGEINRWTNIIWSFLYVFIPAVLILLEPDLGSTIVLMCIWGGIILISPIKKKFLIILLVAACLVGGMGWKFALKPFQRDRIKVFLDPQLDPQGKGYNVRQAAIAVGSGQLLGRGLGKGMQSQHKFLPERQTDFIFAASSEEIGFLGTVTILVLYLFLFFRLLKIVKMARDDLGMYIAAGVFFLFFIHVVVNIGMNIGLLPVTGIPLPFISAGGSSLIVELTCLGIVQNIAMQSKILRF